MAQPLTKRYTLTDLRKARETGAKVPMLTCYDYTTARHMQQAGVPTLLVGDSAANVILGHDTTLPVPLSFMIQITAAVRRGAPLAMVVADLPFGSYQASTAQGMRAAMKMVQQTGCDCVKLEVAESHLPLVERLADAGVAVMAHVGLRPQAVHLMGGYRYQGRTAEDAMRIVRLCMELELAGAAAFLLEAVPPEVSAAVVEKTHVPVIGCGAGPACHGYVVVTQDALGLTPMAPRFVPRVGDLATPLTAAFAAYVDQVQQGKYPQPEHNYEMPVDQRQALEAQLPGL